VRQRSAGAPPLELILRQRTPTFVDDVRRVACDLGGRSVEVFAPESQPCLPGEGGVVRDDVHLGVVEERVRGMRSPTVSTRRSGWATIPGPVPDRSRDRRRAHNRRRGPATRSRPRFPVRASAARTAPPTREASQLVAGRGSAPAPDTRRRESTTRAIPRLQTPRRACPRDEGLPDRRSGGAGRHRGSRARRTRTTPE
jgi:hypothetical protein